MNTNSWTQYCRHLDYMAPLGTELPEVVLYSNPKTKWHELDKDPSRSVMLIPGDFVTINRDYNQ